jgi:hypothetical protein
MAAVLWRRAVPLVELGGCAGKSPCLPFTRTYRTHKYLRAVNALCCRGSAHSALTRPAALVRRVVHFSFTGVDAMSNKRWTMAAVAMGALLSSAPALAEEFRCTGAVGAVALDNLFVPDGATCVLDRTRLNGSVVVGRGATLRAHSVAINGNLQAEGAAFVGVGGYSTVGGSVQIVQGGGASIERARIKGDIQFESNNSPIAANHNSVGGSLQAFQNMGGLVFNGNRMNGNMQCKENIPAPVGRGNQSPSKEDQCARL